MILKMILAVLLLLPTVVSASEMENTCWPYSGDNAFRVTLTKGSFTSSKAGSTAVFSYTGVPRYYMSCWANYPAGTNPYVLGFYQSRIDLPPSDFGNGFYKVNEDFDIKITIGGDGGHVVPSTQSIQGPIVSDGDGEVNRRYTKLARFASDVTSSNITLRLRRDQLGGVVRIPPMVKLFRGYRLVSGSRGIPTVINDAPIMSMSTAGQLIQVPVVCTINHGVSIEVDFGDIDNTKLSSDGSSYVKTIPLQYRCNTAVTQDVDISLIAAPAAFSSELIATTLPDDVGVVVRHNGQVVKPNQKFSTTLLDGFGQDELQVAPVARDLTKSITGSFMASATLIMLIQ
ncbi:TPA: fimbrial protein [Serratia fonticola]